MSDTQRLERTAIVASRLERLPHTSYQSRIFWVIATAWFFDSIDLGALTFVLGSIRAEFGLSLAEAGLLSSASFAGMFFGASSAGMLADRYGRRSVFQVSMLVWGLGSLLCGLAPTVTFLAGARFLVGVGMGMEFPVAQAMAAEFAPAAKRGRYIAWLEGCWPLGFIAAGLLSYFILPVWGWRGVFIVTAVPALFVFVVRRAVPESPRWLTAKGYDERAEETLSAMEAEVRNRLGRELPLPVQIHIGSLERPTRFPFFELWSKEYARRTITTWGMWFFALLGYYGLTTWLGALLQQGGYSVTTSVLYVVAISLAGIPGFLTSAWLVESWGRKATCVSMFIGAAATCYLYGTAPNLTLLLIFGSAMQFFLFGMWSVLYAYTPELYPTRARATGAGWASAIGRLGSLIGPLIVAFLIPVGGNAAVFSVGAGSFIVAALIVLSLGDETKGRVVEELSR